MIKEPLGDHVLVKNLLSDPHDLRPFLIRNSFNPTTKSAQHLRLSPDSIKIFEEPNAGGNSLNSEGLSMEVLAQLYDARDVITEMEVTYWNDNWKKCDYIANVCGNNVGVSVTRGMFYPNPDGFERKDAEKLLHRKLDGLVVARSGIQGAGSFQNSILHIWCETHKIADIITDVWDSLSAEMRDNIVVILTVTDASYIFYDKHDRSLELKYRRNSI